MSTDTPENTALDKLWRVWLVFRESTTDPRALAGATWASCKAASGGCRTVGATASLRGWDTTARSGSNVWPPAAYPESPCCRAPFRRCDRDVRETGLICQHCDDLVRWKIPRPANRPRQVGRPIRRRAWRRALGRAPAPVAVITTGYDEAAKQAERLLGQMGAVGARLLELYPPWFGRITMNA